MKIKLIRKFLEYVYSNYVGNFLGFVVAMMSSRLVSHYFTTRSIKNLWGLTARKTVIDKHTYSNLEWAITIVIGFIVFEIVSKWFSKKLQQLLPKYRFTKWLVDTEEKEKEAVKPAVATITAVQE
ncbi:MAG: hypothetical protein J7623_19685 [Chitinophaga sp.]|uniref:hypothetical protein n=1 Tax=Chitinophaga sp. TaxID=1869181 RepID=UPI001B1AD7C9|nr:hypothetical protein [Chitinophaga sp.]MBO9730871.1 hypothetical protein [Chitinophaga sp.]